jgi:hypothetical protein
MFKLTQYRAKATEYGDLAETSTDSDQRHGFQRLEQRFTVLADNEKWLADNYRHTVTSAEHDRPNILALADEEEHILRCLGAAVIMQWSTIPTTLQRELFDTAGSLGDVPQTVALRGPIARFLHSHKSEAKAHRPHDETPVTRPQ